MTENNEKLKKALFILNELERLLTDRISDLYEVRGGMQSRHAYCYYREHVVDAINLLKTQ